ncbi:MAG: PPC domain-containing protein, partial [Bdellovibrionota bacterium]|nr:PPC domain-containing protein [Bdellovibrionota bacterium]
SLPRSSETYTISIHSRANNSTYKASILNNHSEMTYYSIATTVTPSSDQAVGSIYASYKDDLEGGAFNILDQIYEANDYLRTQASSCSTAFSSAGCSDFDVAPQVQVFWTPGCNPYKYYYTNATSGLSFFVSGTNRLYILGGIDSDVDTSDTDHFDDVIILHEYGHFIESSYSRSDSPGGSHDGDSIIDPRLAWSEAWASFFASAVRDKGEYIDTYGNISGTTGFYFKYDVENNSTGSGSLDPSSGSYSPNAGEGNFREMALLRTLWDSIDTNSADDDNDGVEGSFQELWAVFSGSNGVKNSSYAFINAGLFFELQNSLGSTDVSGLFDAEHTSFINANRNDYSTTLSDSICSSVTITPENSNNKTENGTYSNSNMEASNDFYHLKLNSATSGSITLRFTGTGDLDLYLYKDDYTFGTESSMQAYSVGSNAGGGTETITLNNLAAGDYMINVLSDTTNGKFSNSYTLEIPGGTSCP